MNEIQISFRSGDLTLEGLLANPGANAPAAVVCHPHPLYGGSMYNNVVDAAVAAMTYLLAQPGVRKAGAVMAGYSFGAMVAVSAGYERAEIARIVAIALPLAMADARIPDGASKPVLLVSGDRDSYSPVAGLQALKSRSATRRGSRSSPAPIISSAAAKRNWGA